MQQVWATFATKDDYVNLYPTPALQKNTSIYLKASKQHNSTQFNWVFHVSPI